jgi:hypothetical protein
MRIVIPSDHQTLVTCDIHNAIILQQKKSACVRVLRRGTDIQTDMLLIGVETEVIASVNKTSVYPVGIVWGGGNGSAVGKEGYVEEGWGDRQGCVDFDLCID